MGVCLLDRGFARNAASYSYAVGYPFDKENLRNSIKCSDHACHGDELPFTFESYWENFNDAGRRISQSMATYWTNSATSQDRGNEKYMYIQDPLQIGENYLKNDCDFSDQIGYK
jgi:carboxylesterase type B